MLIDDQTRVIEFLARPSTHGNAAVERIDTHTAVVFLAGTRAYKLKRAVRFDYLDFSTPERRRAFCNAEVQLNQRSAPSLYLGVVPITCEPDGSLTLGGGGKAIEWLVVMNRFPQDALLDRRAADARLELAMMPSLAQAIACFHNAAEARTDHGGRSGMQWVIDGNAAGFAEFGTGCLDPSVCQLINDEARHELDRRAALLDARRASGYVRQCHGDLHLRNIVLLESRPTLFDGVEFNDEISCIDVQYDLAFLLMDLWHRRLPRHANVVWNRYLADTDDLQALALMPLFLSCRAAIRAKTSATSARLQNNPDRRNELEQLARGYLDMAEQLLHPVKPSLIAIGGFSGAGKSTLALGLAPSVGAVPGAIVIRSDEIRKRLCGVSPSEPLSREGYSATVSARVYQTAADHAAIALRAGRTVIIDAVFGRQSDRQVIERVAAAADVPFVGLWLEAPHAELMTRVSQRSNDPSDADAQVILRQLHEKTGLIDWRQLDASGLPEQVLQCATGFLPRP